MSTAPDVVITGVGATTPLGGDAVSTWEAALAGKSGIRTLDNDWAEKYGIPVSFAGTLAVPAAETLSRPETKRMDPSAQYAMVAAREAWADAGSPEIDGERLGAVVASGIGGIWTLLDGWDTVREKGARRVLPMTVPMLMPNSPAANVSIEFGARAGVHAPVSACASGAEAIAWGIEMIRSGRADVVIAGGTEAVVHPMPISAFAAMKALSTRNDDPAGASRPYDVTRDGFVMSEGAAVVVLESADHARARDAKVYGRVAGYGMSGDAHHIAAPEPTGVGQTAAMQRAMSDADVVAQDVVHVNAHATSTNVGDMIEVRGIRAVLGADADHVRLSATKSMTGHLLGAAGALETIFSVLALRDRLAPPTINVTQPEPELDLDLVRDAPRELPEGQIAAINNSFGFGGHNVALVVTSV